MKIRCYNQEKGGDDLNIGSVIRIKREEADLAGYKKELAGYEAYDPTLLTEDRVKELVDEYFAQNGKTC